MTDSLALDWGEIKLTQINNKSYFGQIDSTFISKLDNIFTYKYPLIVQILNHTENSESWYSEYNPVLASSLRFITKILFKILNLQNKPDGWYFLYFMFSDNGRITIYLLILLILLLFYNKTNIIRLTIKTC